jgi:hypothetical protein
MWRVRLAKHPRANLHPYRLAGIGSGRHKVRALYLSKGVWLWRKLKNDHEARSPTKPKKQRIRVPVLVDVAWALYNNMASCQGWDNIHMTTSPLVTCQCVNVPRRILLHPDLLADPAYHFDSPPWDTYGKVKWDPQCRSGFFIGDYEFIYSPPRT